MKTKTRNPWWLQRNKFKSSKLKRLMYPYYIILLNWVKLDFLKTILFIYSWETQRERGRDTGRGRSKLHAGSPMWDSIPGLQDHTLGWRQVLNHQVTQASFSIRFLTCLRDIGVGSWCGLAPGGWILIPNEYVTPISPSFLVYYFIMCIWIYEGVCAFVVEN